MTDARKASALRSASVGVLIGGTLTPLLIVFVFHGDVSWVTPWVLLMMFGVTTVVADVYERRFVLASLGGLINAVGGARNALAAHQTVLEDHERMLTGVSSRFCSSSIWRRTR